MNARARRGAAERGAGLIEVLVALAIVTFVAVASSNVHVVALGGMHAASFHFALDELSTEMIETLRAHRAEAAGDGFDHDFDDDPPAADATGAAALVGAWRARVADAVTGGATSVACDAGFCRVAIRWPEEIDGTRREQFFRTGTPL